MVGFTGLRRKARRAARRGDIRRYAVMPLTESLGALGSSCWTDLGTVAVPVDRVVGTASRTEDFDRDMRPLRRDLRRRWERVAAASGAGTALPPVRLVQLGEMYFVADGHHRVSVARAAGP